jgi:hypothetical protein
MLGPDRAVARAQGDPINSRDFRKFVGADLELRLETRKMHGGRQWRIADVHVSILLNRKKLYSESRARANKRGE